MDNFLQLSPEEKSHLLPADMEPVVQEVEEAEEQQQVQLPFF